MDSPKMRGFVVVVVVVFVVVLVVVVVVFSNYNNDKLLDDYSTLPVGYDTKGCCKVTSTSTQDDDTDDLITILCQVSILK